MHTLLRQIHIKNNLPIHNVIIIDFYVIYHTNQTKQQQLLLRKQAPTHRK